MFHITSLSDIAGQMTETSAGADTLTVAGVLLPSGGLRQIRKKLPVQLPKWRDATDSDVETVVSIALGECLALSAASVDKTAEQWTNFWQDAADVHRAVASLEKGSVSFLKAATMIKIILFGHSSAACLGNAIFTKSIPDALRRHGMLETCEDVILDNEIQGKDNRDALIEAWRATNSYQPWSNAAGLARKAKSLQLKTEQSEPLLLLADYVAGIVHASHSRVDTLSKSRVSAKAAAHALIRLRSSKRFADYSGTVLLDYFAVYPNFKHFSRRRAA